MRRCSIQRRSRTTCPMARIAADCRRPVNAGAWPRALRRARSPSRRPRARRLDVMGGIADYSGALVLQMPSRGDVGGARPGRTRISIGVGRPRRSRATLRRAARAGRRRQPRLRRARGTCFAADPRGLGGLRRGRVPRARAEQARFGTAPRADLVGGPGGQGHELVRGAGGGHAGGGASPLAAAHRAQASRAAVPEGGELWSARRAA